MPYIDLKDRSRLAGGEAPGDAGQLNFAITRLIDDYLHRRGGVRYLHINEVIGVLECAKLELYRRIAAPYEDSKIAENGDVYSV